jgi:hypothetical protein
MNGRQSADEKRWLRVLSTLNEFQARLFVADKALESPKRQGSWPAGGS